MVQQLALFLETEVPLDTVAQALARILGHELVKKSTDFGPAFQTTACYIEFRLYADHGLDDDCGIAFSQYVYQLQLVPFEEGLALPHFQQLYVELARFLGSTLASLTRGRALLVANLQHQVAHFGG